MPLRVGLVCMVAGFSVIGGLNWFAGGQHSILTMFPFVLAAVGLGLGLVAAGAVLYAANRRHLGEARAEDGLASMLIAAARLARARQTADSDERS